MGMTDAPQIEEAGDNSKPKRMRSAPAAENHRIPPKKILLVEDEEQVVVATCMALRHDGHAVETAENAETALTLFESGKYDLVIADFSLPKMDGFRLVSEIRSRCPTQPIIMVTAYAEVMMSEAGLLARVNAL